MIEREVMKEDHINSLPEPEGTIMIRPQGTVSFKQIARAMFRVYPKRSLLGFSLMVGQAFLYNAIFFTYAIDPMMRGQRFPNQVVILSHCRSNKQQGKIHVTR